MTHEQYQNAITDLRKSGLVADLIGKLIMGGRSATVVNGITVYDQAFSIFEFRDGFKVLITEGGLQVVEDLFSSSLDSAVSEVISFYNKC